MRVKLLLLSLLICASSQGAGLVNTSLSGVSTGGGTNSGTNTFTSFSYYTNLVTNTVYTNPNAYPEIVVSTVKLLATSVNSIAGTMGLQIIGGPQTLVSTFGTNQIEVPLTATIPAGASFYIANVSGSTALTTDVTNTFIYGNSSGAGGGGGGTGTLVTNAYTTNLVPQGLAFSTNFGSGVSYTNFSDGGAGSIGQAKVTGLTIGVTYNYIPNVGDGSEALLINGINDSDGGAIALSPVGNPWGGNATPVGGTTFVATQTTATFMTLNATSGPVLDTLDTGTLAITTYNQTLNNASVQGDIIGGSNSSFQHDLIFQTTNDLPGTGTVTGATGQNIITANTPGSFAFLFNHTFEIPGYEIIVNGNQQYWLNLVVDSSHISVRPNLGPGFTNGTYAWDSPAFWNSDTAYHHDMYVGADGTIGTKAGSYSLNATGGGFRIEDAQFSTRFTIGNFGAYGEAIQLQVDTNNENPVVVIATLAPKNSLNIDTNGNLVLGGGGTNISTFTLVNTNWIDGGTYTNLTGRTIQVWAPCKVVPASVSGFATYELRVPSVTTDYVGEVTIVGTIADIWTNRVGPVWVAPAGTFVFTNISQGAGNSAAILNGGQYMVY